MRRPPMARKWILVWSAIAVFLLWKLADVRGEQTAIGFPLSAIFLQTEAGQMDASQPETSQPEASQPEASQKLASDQLSHPPINQLFSTGDYRFVVTAINQWQTPDAIGQLYQGDQLLWEKSLPQQYGPRFVVVGSQGQVLLVDEFINVASPYALMLFGIDGEQVVTHSFEDIQQVLSVSPADLTQQAASGWWVSAEPQLAQVDSAQAADRSAGQSSTGTFAETVSISTGGTYLSVNLSTGELTHHQGLY